MMETEERSISLNIDDPFLTWLNDQARTLLEPLGNRWLHVQGVAKRARWVGLLFDLPERRLLLAAAWLHDIAYAPFAASQTGFHPLDGAFYASTLGNARLACLVAHHSEARFEAHLRGLDREIQHFPREISDLAEALIFCDMTTSPTGKLVSMEERLAEVLTRYGPGDLVTLALQQAQPTLALATERTAARLHASGLLTVDPDEER